MSRKLFGMMLGLGVLASVVLSAPSAHATYNLYIYQNGSNVDASGSGSLNTNGVTLFNGGGTVVGISIDTGPNQIAFSVGPYVSSTQGFNGSTTSSMLSAMVNLNAVNNIWQGSFGQNYSTAGGNPVEFGITNSAFSIITPTGYTSGAQLGTSTDTFNNETLAGMNLNTGNYSLTWGTGANADSFNIFIGTNPNSSPSPSATPEPSTWVLFGTGILAMRVWTYRRQKSLQS